jgi:hypothetical protein
MAQRAFNVKPAIGQPLHLGARFSGRPLFVSQASSRSLCLLLPILRMAIIMAQEEVELERTQLRVRWERCSEPCESKGQILTPPPPCRCQSRKDVKPVCLLGKFQSLAERHSLVACGAVKAVGEAREGFCCLAHCNRVL